MAYFSIFTAARCLRAAFVSGLLFISSVAISAVDGVPPVVQAQPVPPGAANLTKPAPAAPATAKPVQKSVETKPLWVELTPMQQQALAPLANEWNKIDPFRKKKWLEIGNKFPAMKPDEQTRMHERMREWAKLTPDQRRVARESYARAKKLDPDQKSAQWQKYQQLSDEQKKKLTNDPTNKKNVANLPSPQSQVKPVTPIKPTLKPAPVSTLPPATIPNKPAASAAPTQPAVPPSVPTQPPAQP